MSRAQAVFLDRDGVISKDIGVTSYPKKLRVFRRSHKAIRLLNKEYKVIVVTNQSHVARGLCREEDVVALNKWLVAHMKKKGARIDAVFYCPHHPERHHKDIKPHSMKYRIICTCRKPGTGMLMAAKRRFGIDMGRSFMVGDRTVDIAAGSRAGCRTILVRTGQAGRDGKVAARPDHVVKDIYSAALLIKRSSR